MQDHPMLGAILFVMGVILVLATYATPNGSSAPLLVGHILAFNGALLCLLGCQKRELEKARLARPIVARRLPNSHR